MEHSENPQLNPQDYKTALEKQLIALRKVRKIYRKQVLPGSKLYHSTLKTINSQINEVFDEWDLLIKNNPELDKSFKQRFFDKVAELGSAAAGATQRH